MKEKTATATIMVAIAVSLRSATAQPLRPASGWRPPGLLIER